jgi:hypothetical protein
MDLGCVILVFRLLMLKLPPLQMDVINLISKVEGLPDAPITYPDEPYQPASLLYANGRVSLSSCLSD